MVKELVLNVLVPIPLECWRWITSILTTGKRVAVSGCEEGSGGLSLEPLVKPVAVGLEKRIDRACADIARDGTLTSGRLNVFMKKCALDTRRWHFIQQRGGITVLLPALSTGITQRNNS